MGLLVYCAVALQSSRRVNVMRIHIQKGASVGVLLRYNMLRSILTISSIAMADWFAATFLHPGLRPAVCECDQLWLYAIELT